MPFHVYLFRPYGQNRIQGRPWYFRNLAEEELVERIVEPWMSGEPMTWSGETAPSVEVEKIRISWTEEPISADDNPAQVGTDVTNEWITGPAGSRQAASSRSSTDTRLKNPRRVMVVHGRNLKARDAMFTFLRSLHLAPIEWEEAVAETGMGAPYTLEAVQSAMDVAQAVVVILTAEDQAGLLPDLTEDQAETMLEGQPRQNVMVEAGLAMGVGRAHTILVELGRIRSASDFHGINVIRLTNEAPTRSALKNRLRTAGCDLDDSGSDWVSSNAGGDFEACVVDAPLRSVRSFDGVTGIPDAFVQGQLAEISVRCFQLPPDASITCRVTDPIGHVYDAVTQTVPAGRNQTIHSTRYPLDFEGAGAVAGDHAVEWLAVSDHEEQLVVVDSFRFP